MEFFFSNLKNETFFYLFYIYFLPVLKILHLLIFLLICLDNAFSSGREWRASSGSRNKSLIGSLTPSPANSSASSGKTSFLANFNPVRWGKCSASQPLFPAQDSPHNNVCILIDFIKRIN